MEGRAVLERLCQILSALTLDLVAHKIQIEETDTLADEVTEGACSNVCDLVVAQIDLINMDSVTLKRCTDNDQVIVSDAVGKHVLMVTVNDDVETVVLIVGLLEVLDEGVVGLETSLL